jgi:hypothetical protein
MPYCANRKTGNSEVQEDLDVHAPACLILLQKHVVPVAWAMVTNFLVISVVGCKLRKSDFIKIDFRTKVRMEELL